MTLNPHIQSIAQAELDALLQGRLPTFGDRAQLPYVDALVKEVLRWHPVAPLGTSNSRGEKRREDVDFIYLFIWRARRGPARFE
jgi:hypothetical protein